MDLRHRQRMLLSTWLGINLLAAVLGVFATIRLVFWVWSFLFAASPFASSAGATLFPEPELRPFFLIGFTVAGMLIGVVTGLVQWWIMCRLSPLSFRYVLISILGWTVGLPLSYGIFAVLLDILRQMATLPLAAPIASSMAQLSLPLFFLIYGSSGVIASIIEWFMLKNYR